METRSKVKGVP
jgi:hypothetical protein